MQLAFEVVDPSSRDQATLIGSINWGDGFAEDFHTTSFNQTHAYQPGTYAITSRPSGVRAAAA